MNVRKIHSYDEKDSLLKIKEKLNSTSPTLCPAKWLQVSLHLTTGKTHSCYHPPAHDIGKDSLMQNPSILHNTPLKKKERTQMLAGIRPSGCSYCWKIEDSGGEYSDRHYRSLEPWAMERFDEVAKSDGSEDIIPSYVEVNFNQACQFKCSYCSPHLSSTWMEEVLAHGPYPTKMPHNSIEGLKESGIWPIPAKEENPFVDAFWKWWPDLYPKLKVFRMTGGEPLVDHNTFRILNYIEKNPNHPMSLALTSNLCPPQKQMKKFVDKARTILRLHHVYIFTVFASIDCWGREAEYIRHGLNTEAFEKNLRHLMKKVPDILVSFIITTNALSIFSLKRLLEKILQWQREFNYFGLYKHGKNKIASLFGQKKEFPLHPCGMRRIFLDTPYLRFPKWQALDILPEGLAASYLKECLAFMQENQVDERKGKMHGFTVFDTGKIERLIALSRVTVEEDQLKANRANFFRFFNEHDKRRGTNFLKTFPKLRDFWFECEKLSKEN